MGGFEYAGEHAKTLGEEKVSRRHLLRHWIALQQAPSDSTLLLSQFGTYKTVRTRIW